MQLPKQCLFIMSDKNVQVYRLLVKYLWLRNCKLVLSFRNSFWQKYTDQVLMVFTFLCFQIYAMCTLDFSREFESMDKVSMMWNMTYFTVCSAYVLLMKFAYLDDSREYFQMVYEMCMLLYIITLFLWPRFCGSWICIYLYIFRFPLVPRCTLYNVMW